MHEPVLAPHGFVQCLGVLHSGHWTLPGGVLLRLYGRELDLDNTSERIMLFLPSLTAAS